MRAYCYASGLIESGSTLPDGAITIATGPERPLKEFIETVARHGYRTETINGRPTAIRGTEHLLVPGIPEALDQTDRLLALYKFLDWIRDHAPKTVVVL